MGRKIKDVHEDMLAELRAVRAKYVDYIDVFAALPFLPIGDMEPPEARELMTAELPFDQMPMQFLRHVAMGAGIASTDREVILAALNHEVINAYEDFRPPCFDAIARESKGESKTQGPIDGD